MWYLLRTRHHTKHLVSDLRYPSQWSHEQGVTIVPILQMRRLSLRRGEEVAQLVSLQSWARNSDFSELNHCTLSANLLCTCVRAHTHMLNPSPAISTLTTLKCSHKNSHMAQESPEPFEKFCLPLLQSTHPSPHSAPPNPALGFSSHHSRGGVLSLSRPSSLHFK